MISNAPGTQHGLAVGIMGFGLAFALGVGLHARALTLDTHDLTVVTAVLTFVACGAWCLFRLGAKRLACALFSSTILFAIVLIALLETALLATHGHPFADPVFAAADAVIAPWLDWQSVAAWFLRHPVVSGVCEWVYHSIAWQPFALIMALCWSRRLPEVWRFIGMWTFALIICQIVFALYPGVGAYVFHHVDPALASPTSEAVSSGQLRLLTKLRAASMTRIDAGCIGGIITFPSFHAVAAALLARGYWRIPALRWPFAALNAAMLATAVPMGGHYFVDLVAGLAVAGFTICLFDASPIEWHDTSGFQPFRLPRRRPDGLVRAGNLA